MFNWKPLPLPSDLLGESPMWHALEQCLYWVDIPGCTLHRWEPNTQQHQYWELDSETGCVAAVQGGGLLLAQRAGLRLFDPQSGHYGPRMAPLYDPSHTRFNDGKVGPGGRFWVGTLYEPRDQPSAQLYMLSREGLNVVVPSCTVSNGLAFSPDGRRAYWADTFSHQIFILALDLHGMPAAAPQLWKTFAKRASDQALEDYTGRPDGAAVDVQGRYWVAMFEGQRLLCFDHDGALLYTVPLPVRCATMPAFGGYDGRTLFLTTARDKRPLEELHGQPLAGHMLYTHVEVAGQPIPMLDRNHLPSALL